MFKYITQRSVGDFIQRAVVNPESQNFFPLFLGSSWLKVCSRFSGDRSLLSNAERAQVRLRPSSSVDLRAHLPRHNKQVIMPASRLTTGCQDQFVLVGQRRRGGWQVTPESGAYRWIASLGVSTLQTSKLLLLTYESYFFFSEVLKWSSFALLAHHQECFLKFMFWRLKCCFPLSHFVCWVLGPGMICIFFFVEE